MERGCDGGGAAWLALAVVAASRGSPAAITLAGIKLFNPPEISHNPAVAEP
jgi:hypothetical protein